MRAIAALLCCLACSSEAPEVASLAAAPAEDSGSEPVSADSGLDSAPEAANDVVSRGTAAETGVDAGIDSSPPVDAGPDAQRLFRCQLEKQTDGGFEVAPNHAESCRQNGGECVFERDQDGRIFTAWCEVS